MHWAYLPARQGIGMILSLVGASLLARAIADGDSAEE
jgi:hypothetical protein